MMLMKASRKIKAQEYSLNELVKWGKDQTPWDLANKAIYDLCKKNPRHRTEEEIISKIWIVGRTYSAAVERRRKKDDHTSDEFYQKKVAPAILEADLDMQLSRLRAGRRPRR